mmetsp:Transcript_19934/g.62489  ORF Transcript_19934/g.62489 Transcript_19934/m.62489 type:complete len:322 (-) Transcript_19934:437-1402(-)
MCERRSAAERWVMVGGGAGPRAARGARAGRSGVRARSATGTSPYPTSCPPALQSRPQRVRRFRARRAGRTVGAWARNCVRPRGPKVRLLGVAATRTSDSDRRNQRRLEWNGLARALASSESARVASSVVEVATDHRWDTGRTRRARGPGTQLVVSAAPCKGRFRPLVGRPCPPTSLLPPGNGARPLRRPVSSRLPRDARNSRMGGARARRGANLVEGAHEQDRIEGAGPRRRAGEAGDAVKTHASRGPPAPRRARQADGEEGLAHRLRAPVDPPRDDLWFRPVQPDRGRISRRREFRPAAALGLLRPDAGPHVEGRLPTPA